jgi:hypothetical protein
VDRTAPPPSGYGLYTVLLTRTANRNTERVMSELFATTGSASEAALKPANLNLITIPVKNAGVATGDLTSARNAPDAAATKVMQQYDFDHAAMLISNVCRRDRGAAVVEICGSSPDGPLLVTTQHPINGLEAPGARILIVNLSTTPPAAIGEVLAVYRGQILEKDFENRNSLDGWRLGALNYLLEAAQLLPRISKAYAETVSQ